MNPLYFFSPEAIDGSAIHKARSERSVTQRPCRLTKPKRGRRGSCILGLAKSLRERMKDAETRVDVTVRLDDPRGAAAGLEAAILQKFPDMKSPGMRAQPFVMSPTTVGKAFARIDALLPFTNRRTTVTLSLHRDTDAVVEFLRLFAPMAVSSVSAETVEQLDAVGVAVAARSGAVRAGPLEAKIFPFAVSEPCEASEEPENCIRHREPDARSRSARRSLLDFDDLVALVSADESQCKLVVLDVVGTLLVDVETARALTASIPREEPVLAPDPTAAPVMGFVKTRPNAAEAVAALVRAVGEQNVVYVGAADEGFDFVGSAQLAAHDFSLAAKVVHAPAEKTKEDCVWGLLNSRIGARPATVYAVDDSDEALDRFAASPAWPAGAKLVLLKFEPVAPASGV